MFFILSKLLLFVLQPSVWLIFFLSRALLLPRYRNSSLKITFLLLFFFTNPFIINQLAFFWETPTQVLNPTVMPYDYGIVLGGYAKMEKLNTQNGNMEFNTQASRLTSALRLYQTKKIKKIILTGGSGDIFNKEQANEAVEARKFLLDVGVLASDILIDSISKNTRENAMQTAILLKKFHSKDSVPSCLLITSAFHLPRARACFQAVGVAHEVFPSAYFYVAPQLSKPNSYLLPEGDEFFKWQVFLKEWVGFLVYKAKGYA